MLIPPFPLIGSIQYLNDSLQLLKIELFIYFSLLNLCLIYSYLIMPKITGGSYCAVAECTNSSVKSHKNNMNLSFHR